MTPGYKHTEVGVIPEEWTVSRLRDLAEIRSGVAKNSNVAVNDPIRVHYLRVANVQDGFLDLSEMSTLEISRNDLKRYAVAPGDVLMNEGGDLDQLGRGSIWLGQFDPCVHQNHVFVVRCGSRLNPQYLNTWSGGPAARRYFLVAGKQTTNLASINKTALGDLPVAVPPISEQGAIAAALSDVDALLEGLARLIAKKRDIKHAAMQQLLTGQTRLPGFHGDWEVKRLGDVAHIKTGSRNNEDKVEDGQYPFFVRSDIVERIDSYSYDCEAILVPGEGRIGDIFHYIKGPFDVHQRVYAITQFRPDVSAKFVHLYMSMHFGGWAMQNTVKATVDSLRLPTFQTFEMRIPRSTDEQSAIAAILADMDAELATLESRRDKTRALKQAMMQELLTGKTRLVEPVMVANAVDSAKTNGRPANVHFKRSVLAAEIVDRLHEEPTFGHVKFEKMIFLVEHLCAVDTGSSYHRDAAGPYDNRAMRSIDSQLRKQKWFDAQELSGRYRYVPMTKRGGHKEYFERYFGGIRDSFERILGTLRTFDTERCEIIATLFAAWDDLMQQHASISDEAIVHEVLNNWHESKKRIPEERWRKALSWMRDKGFVPHQVSGELS